MPLGDNLIRKTSITGKTSKVNNTNIVSNPIGKPSKDPGTDTFGTKKMTFYVKQILLEKVYNFSYWERHTVTEAINKVIEDGLKGKNTKPRPGGK
jgi:hypothetical protein